MVFENEHVQHKELKATKNVYACNNNEKRGHEFETEQRGVYGRA